MGEIQVLHHTADGISNLMQLTLHFDQKLERPTLFYDHDEVY